MQMSPRLDKLTNAVVAARGESITRTVNIKWRSLVQSLELYLLLSLVTFGTAKGQTDFYIPVLSNGASADEN